MTAPPRRLRSALSGIATLALGLGLLAATPGTARAADVAVPQAPVISVISATETLPFTLDGAGTIEVAVLTAGQSPATATWTARTTLPLTAYAGQDIRVLARAAGTTDPAQYFDATYEVRDTYSPGQGLGTETNPFIGVPGNDARLRGWATGWRDVSYGPNVVESWKKPENAVGPVGGAGYDGNMSVVVLGDKGRITMTFGSAIRDGAGADFAVFENGFRVSGGKFDFVELGYVEVSSNGTDFVRFDSATKHTTAVGGFAGIEAALLGGLAGRDLNGWGTPFDLKHLANKPAVRSGAVDLEAITAVRIVDISGDGSDLDSFGRPIYDPFPTVGSGGFDLRGVGVLNQAAPAISKPTISHTSTTAATVRTSVSPGAAGAQSVRLEVATTPDHSDATVRGTATVPAASGVEALSFDLAGLTTGTTYHYRVVASGAGETTASDWVSFTKTAASIAIAGAPTHVRVADTISTTVRATVTPATDGPQSWRVEYSDNAEHTNPVTVAAPAGSNSVTVPDLKLRTDYWARLVTRSTDGVEKATDWSTFKTLVNPANVSPTLISRVGDKARLQVNAQPGTDESIQVALQVSTNSGHTTGSRLTPPQTAPGTAQTTPLVFEIDGLPTTTTFARAVTTRTSGAVTNSGNWAIYAETAPTVRAPVVTPSGTSAEIVAQVIAGTHGTQSSVLEVSPNADHSAAVTTEPVVGPGGNLSYTVPDLAPGTTYWVRGVTTSQDPIAAGFSANSDWVEFTTAPLTDALGAATAVARRTDATVTVPVTAGAFDRSVRVEHSTNPDHTDPTRTVAQVVAAGTSPGDLAFDLTGLPSHTEHWWRVVSTSAGEDETTDWASFTTAKTPAELGTATVSAVGDHGATITVPVTAGDVAQEVRVQFTTRADQTGGSTSGAVAVPAGTAPVTASVVLDDLASGREFHYRVLVTAADGDEVASEWARFTTSTPAAPTAAISAGAPQELQVGETVTVNWSSSDADSLVATGDWSGDKAPSGSETFVVDEARTWTFGLEARGPGGRTPVSTSVVVVRPAATLTLSPISAPAYVGAGVAVVASGLDAGEEYAVTVSGMRVATGTANAAGTARTRITLPRALAPGRRTVVVTGATDTRTGSTAVQVVGPKKLRATVSKKRVKARKQQQVTVTGLVAGEPVRVRYRGRLVSPAGAVARADGSYRVRFKVGAGSGKRTVKVLGLRKTRQATVTFRIR